MAEYIPALKYDRLTGFYDIILEKLVRENTFKKALISNFISNNPKRILDLGCGTATLSIMVKKAFPEAEVIGLDGDNKVLKIAHEKTKKAGVEIKYVKGLSFEIPFPDNTFDIVVSSLLFHHLTNENKTKTLQEVFRVLKFNGELHVADWGKAQSVLMRAAFLMVQILDGFATTRDNVKGLLPEYIRRGGFGEVKELGQYRTIFGSISLYFAKKFFNGKHPT